jgi:hypothetical protein
MGSVVKPGFYKLLTFSLIVLVGSALFPHSQSYEVPSPSTRSFSSSPFAPNIYKVATEVKGPDKGDVSVNFQAGPGNIWQGNGYNAELWAFCSDCHTYTTSGLPENGGFELPLTANANDGKPFYAIQDTSANVSGTYLAAQNTNPNFVYSGISSFHGIANVSGSRFGWSGISQNFVSHFWYGPLVSKINFTGHLYPVRLDNAITGLDALIVFRFDLSYWNQSSIPTRMFFVFQNNAQASLASFPYSNDTNTTVFAMSAATPLSLGQWNRFSWNLTSAAIQSFGYWRGIDERVTDLTVQSWSDNGATSEFYLDSLTLASQSTTVAASQSYHNTEESILSHYNSTAFPLVSGVTDWGSPQDLIWFNTATYPGTNAASTTSQISAIQSGGGYPFIAAPYSGTIYNVSAVPIYSDASAWAGASTAAGGSGQWDNYLTHGIMATGFVEQHPYLIHTVDNYAVNGPATFAYSDALNGQSILEAIAQGRSFGEYAWFKTGTMTVYLAAENDNVGMGRFPVYVDPSTTAVSLHVKLGNTPVLSSPLSIRIIEDGNIVQTVTLPLGATTYDNVIGPISIPNSSDYFRLEIYSSGNPILAYSNPIFFTHAPLLNGYWLAATPGLVYGAGKSFLSNIGQTQVSLRFTVNAGTGVPMTTKIYYPSKPSSIANATSWSYDQTNRLLTVNTLGTVELTVNPPDFSVSSSPASLTLVSSQIGTTSVTASSLNQFTGTVSLSSNASSSQIIAILNASSVSLSSGGTGTVSLTVQTSECVSGTFSVVVTATSGSITHSFSVSVGVTSACGGNAGGGGGRPPLRR